MMRLDGTDWVSRLFLAGPDGRTLSGFWWAVSAAQFGVVSIVLLTEEVWLVGTVLVFPTVVCITRALAQVKRGNFAR